MFNFIKKLLVKKEIPIEEISPDSISQWFEARIEKIEKDASVRVDSLRKQLLEGIKDTRHALNDLGSATLRNPNISTRELHFMDGNRKSYLQRSERFLGEVEDIINYEVVFFLNHYQDYLNNFMKSTSRAYAILGQFFGDELSLIASTLKKIDSAVGELRGDTEVHSKNLVDGIRKDISSIDAKLNKKKELKDELEKLEDKIVRMKKKLEKLSAKKKDMLASNEYGELLTLKSTSKHIDDELKQLKDLFIQKFSVLERPLKKYQYMSVGNSKLTEHYLTDPLNALSTDRSLNILVILKEVANLLKEAKISVKDKSASKVLKTISLLDKKYFDDFLESYMKLKAQRQENSKAIGDMNIGEEIDILEEEIEKDKRDISSIVSRMDSLKDELDSIDISGLREKVRKEIERLLKININFI